MKIKNKNLLISFLLIIALISFVVACVSPLFTLSKFFIFNNTVSLVSALMELWNENYYVLFIVLFLFSVFFPLIKILLMFYLHISTRISQQRHTRLIGVLEQVGKWSMLDVFVVAILLVTIKLGPMASVEVHYGLYLFSAAIILMMLISHVMHRKG